MAGAKSSVLVDAILCCADFQLWKMFHHNMKPAWVWARANALKKFHTAEIDIALMGLSFHPQALLRIARRGGRAGRGEVAKRFNCLLTEDWGKLIDLWEEDVKLVEEKNARRSAAQRQPLTEEEEKNKKRTSKG